MWLFIFIDIHRWSYSLLTVFLSGLLFRLGLTISGMINPAKVIGFLDLFGNWDPTLLLVMGAGLMMTVPGFHFIMKRKEPLFGTKFYLPTSKDLDAKLVGGAILFGIGWGIAGFCPGPALSAMATLNSSALMFVVAMVIGMVLHHLLIALPAQSSPT